MSAAPEDVFFTSKGKLFPVPLSKGNCQFVFYNPNAREKQETRVFLDTIKMLANYLGQAQEAVRAFERNKDKLKDTNRSEVSEEGAPEGGGGDRIVLYNRLLNEYTVQGLKMKTELQSSVYEDRGYIFLKRYWYLQESNLEDRWLPCKGGFQFTVNDSAHDMLAFAERWVDRYRKGDVDSDIHGPGDKRQKLE
jgi:hypothetical protein